MKHIVLHSLSSNVQMSLVDQLFERYDVEGERFVLGDNAEFGDWDALLETGNTLIGISYSFLSSSEYVSHPYIGRSNFISFDARLGSLIFALSASTLRRRHCIQAMGTHLYKNESNGFMLALPDAVEWLGDKISLDKVRSNVTDLLGIGSAIQ